MSLGGKMVGVCSGLMMFLVVMVCGLLMDCCWLSWVVRVVIVWLVRLLNLMWVIVVMV